MKHTLYIIIFFAATLSSYAQKIWTLQECMEYAVANSPRVGKQQAQSNINSQTYTEAVAGLFPSVNAVSTGYFNFGRGLDAGTNTYIDVNSFTNNYEIYSSIMLFNGFSNINKARMYRANKLMGKQQLQQEKDMLAFETMESFFRVLYCKGLADLAAQQLNESTESLRQITRMEELGMKGTADVAEIRARHAADSYNLTRSQNQLTISLIQLKEKMNFPIDESLDIEETAFENLVLKSEESAMDIYENALLFLPEAQAAELYHRAHRLSYHSSVGSLFPTLTLSGGYSTNFFRYTDNKDYASFAEQLREKRGSYVGLTLSVPIFNGFSRTMHMKRSKQQLNISQYERDEKLRSLYSEIEQALADMNGQADEYYQSQKQVEATAAAHNVNQRKYSEGLISGIELQTSANRLLQAKVEELNSLLTYWLKQRLVNYYRTGEI